MYKLFLPIGARENSNNTVTLLNGLTFPKYVFVASPIISVKTTYNKPSLDKNINPIYYDLSSNKFTVTKQIKNLNTESAKFYTDSLTSSGNTGSVKIPFDGYLNISELITNLQKQIDSIESQSPQLYAYEQDIGYTAVRENKLTGFEIVSIYDGEDYSNLNFQLSPNFQLKDFLKSGLQFQQFQAQKGLTQKILARNLRNLAVNVLEKLVSANIDFELFSGFTNSVYYASDEEFYTGEAIQLRFPGLTPEGVYLVAKDLLSMLYFDKFYLDYFTDGTPRLTIILTSNNYGFSFGTRFEYNLIHDGKLVNIDKNFIDVNTSSSSDIVNVIPVSSNLTSSNMSIKFLKYNNANTLLRTYIKDLISSNYIQSTEEAVKLAKAIGLDISDLTVTPQNISVEEQEDQTYYTDIAYDTDSFAETQSPSVDYLNAIINNLPKLIKCPSISNGSVSGYPNQSFFPLMSHPGFKLHNDLTSINNQDTTSGEKNLPINIRLNNPLLVKYQKGVTDKVQDTFIGVKDGYSVFSNRLGGLVAGLRSMQNQNLSGNTLFSAAEQVLPKASFFDYLTLVSKIMFGVSDPTGLLLNCSQFDMNGNINTNITNIAAKLAAISKMNMSPMTYDEISLAHEHLNGEKKNLNKNLDGTKLSETRDTSKELVHSITTIDQTANSAPKDIANTSINSTAMLIETQLGQDIKTKTERKTNQESTYKEYDSGSVSDNREYLGGVVISNLNGSKDSQFG